MATATRSPRVAVPKPEGTESLRTLVTAAPRHDPGRRPRGSRRPAGDVYRTYRRRLRESAATGPGDRDRRLGLRLGADPDELRRIIGSKRHTRGIRQARLVVDRATVQSESPGESIVRWFVINSGLPEPASQVKVDTHRGPKWIDLGWPERKIGIEFDGMGKYRDRDDLLAEKQRQDALAEAGGPSSESPGTSSTTPSG